MIYHSLLVGAMLIINLPVLHDYDYSFSCTLIDLPPTTLLYILMCCYIDPVTELDVNLTIALHGLYYHESIVWFVIIMAITWFPHAIWLLTMF